MERISITERPDWREKATEYGFNFHTMYGEPYWSEEAYYKLTLAQVEKLEAVTAELHQMCLQVVEKVIASDELMTKFRIPKHTWGFVRQSWKTNQPSLYSRLDLAWDGVGEPKLLENNADTPTSLYEAAFFQWIWLEDQLNAGNLPADSDQFNSLQEKLIERFGELREQFGFQLLHMACCRDTVEDRGTVQYLQDCAAEAGIATEFLYIEDIGLGIFLDKFSCACQAVLIATKELNRYRIFTFINMEHMQGLFVIVLDSFIRDHFHDYKPCPEFFSNRAEG